MHWTKRFLALAAMKNPANPTCVRELIFPAVVAPPRGMTTRNDTLAEWHTLGNVHYAPPPTAGASMMPVSRASASVLAAIM